MALSTAFELIKLLNTGMLKGAKELAKKEGYTGGETLFLMQTSTGKVLFDIADRRKLDESLVKAAVEKRGQATLNNYCTKLTLKSLHVKGQIHATNC